MGRLAKAAARVTVDERVGGEVLGGELLVAGQGWSGLQITTSSSWVATRGSTAGLSVAASMKPMSISRAATPSSMCRELPMTTRGSTRGICA
jgi:hypothetical protein